MPHRNYWANCGTMVFYSVAISRPRRQAPLWSLPEHTKKAFVREDTCICFRVRNSEWVEWHDIAVSWVSSSLQIHLLSWKNALGKASRPALRAPADVLDSNVQRNAQLGYSCIAFGSHPRLPQSCLAHFLLSIALKTGQVNVRLN